MKLPQGVLAIMELEKLTDYCLNPEHPRGKHQARVFASVGIQLPDAELLRAALLLAASEADAVEGEPSPYGRRYLVDFEWGERALLANP